MPSHKERHTKLYILRKNSHSLLLPFILLCNSYDPIVP